MNELEQVKLILIDLLEEIKEDGGVISDYDFSVDNYKTRGLYLNYLRLKNFYEKSEKFDNYFKSQFYYLPSLMDDMNILEISPTKVKVKVRLISKPYLELDTERKKIIKDIYKLDTYFCRSYYNKIELDINKLQKDKIYRNEVKIIILDTINSHYNSEIIGRKRIEMNILEQGESSPNIKLIRGNNSIGDDTIEITITNLPKEDNIFLKSQLNHEILDVLYKRMLSEFKEVKEYRDDIINDMEGRIQSNFNTIIKYIDTMEEMKHEK